MPSRCHILGLALLMSIWIATTVLSAQQIIASGVDAAGKRHLGSRDFPGLDEPWIRDRIAYAPPEYPYGDRRDRHEGDGLFRISIGLRTGTVAQVRVLKSTGFPSLDSSAVTAIRKWRWKPGRWKEVDMPIRFTMRARR